MQTDRRLRIVLDQKLAPEEHAFDQFMNIIVEHESSLASALEQTLSRSGWAHVELTPIQHQQKYFFETQQNLKTFGQLILFIKKNRTKVLSEFKQLGKSSISKIQKQVHNKIRPDISSETVIAVGDYLPIFAQLFMWSIDPLMARFRNPDHIQTRQYTPHEKGIVGFIYKLSQSFLPSTNSPVGVMENFIKNKLPWDIKSLFSLYVDKLPGGNISGVFVRASQSIKEHCRVNNLSFTELKPPVRPLQDTLKDLTPVMALPESTVTKLTKTASELFYEINLEIAFLELLEKALNDDVPDELIALLESVEFKEKTKSFLLSLGISENEIQLLLRCYSKYYTAKAAKIGDALDYVQPVIDQYSFSAKMLAFLTYSVSFTMSPWVTTMTSAAATVVSAGFMKQVITPAIEQMDIYQKVKMNKSFIHQYRVQLDLYKNQLIDLFTLIPDNALTMADIRKALDQLIHSKKAWFCKKIQSTWENFCKSAAVVIAEIDKLSEARTQGQCNMKTLTDSLDDCQNQLSVSRYHSYFTFFSLYSSTLHAVAEVKQHRNFRIN